jgi:hypothetical protein
MMVVIRAIEEEENTKMHLPLQSNASSMTPRFPLPARTPVTNHADEPNLTNHQLVA